PSRPSADPPTVPLPDPELPDLTVSQLVLLETAVHVQPAGAVTPTVPLPPAAGSDWVVEESVYVQLAAWVTAKVIPAIVSASVRAAPAFAAAENPTARVPEPELPPITT